jgi:hypothetical protein
MSAAAGSAASLRGYWEACMRTQLLLAAFGGLMLVSAAPPGDPIPWEDEDSLRDYPPCSRTVTDRCIQGPGREAASERAMARQDREPAVGGPAEEPSEAYASAGDYPPCSATVTDRCMQTGGRASHRSAVRTARSAPKARHHERRMQIAMRAGERG